MSRLDRFGSRFGGARYRKRRNGHTSPGQYHRRLHSEPLEERRLLTITVDTLVDEADGSIVDGDISLRDAIALAPSGETIDFSVNGTILLTLDELVIDKDITIAGPGADLLTIDASGNDPTPGSTLLDGDDTNDGDGSRVFNVDNGSLANLDVSITQLRLIGGDVDGDGGAISSFERLAIGGLIVSQNIATGFGGGVWIRATDGIVSGDVTILQSEFSGNAAMFWGGGISAETFNRGTVTISGCSVTENWSGHDGGGIRAHGGISALINISLCRVSGNSSVGHGGGIALIATNRGTVELDHVVVEDNSAEGNGGGVHARSDVASSGTSTLSITDSIVAENSAVGYAGGVVVYAIGTGARVAVQNITITGNSAVGGAGGFLPAALNGGVIETSEVTVSENQTSGVGGGVWAFTSDGGRVNVQRSTVTGNVSGADEFGGGAGGGVYVYPASDITIDHTIIAGNQLGGGSDDDVAGVLNAASAYNFIGVDTGLSGISDGGGGNQIGTAAAPIDPLLGPLADNGGPVLPDGSVLMTHALLAGSPAIDAGDPGAVAGVGDVPEFDQRGDPFARVHGGAIDIGSLEVAATAGIPGDGNLDGVVDGLDYLIWAANFGDDPADVPPGSPGNGDFNDDGVVDGIDYIVWASNYGASNEPLSGDGNLDDVVDGLDYLIWAAHYGDDPALDPPGAPENGDYNGDYNGDGGVDGLDYIVWAGGYGSSAAGLAIGRAAYDAVFAMNAESVAMFELTAGGSLPYATDDMTGVTAAVDSVFERLAIKKRSGRA